MWKKHFGLIAAGILTLGLAACRMRMIMLASNTNVPENNGTNNNKSGVYGTNGNQDGMAGNNRLGNGNNDRGDGIDQDNGPLTEDYNKERGDMDFGTRRWDNNGANGRGNGIDNYGARTNGDRNGGDANLSSFSTNRSSENYPHTRAIIVREAQYQYVPTKNDGRSWSKDWDQAAQETKDSRQHQIGDNKSAPNQGSTGSTESRTTGCTESRSTGSTKSSRQHRN